MTDLVLSMDTMMRDLARVQFMLRGIEADVSIFADDKGRILYTSPGAEKLTGWKLSEVVGRSLTLLMPNRYHKLHQQGLERVSSTGGGFDSSRVLFRTLEMPLLTKAGREVGIHLSVAAWRSTEGRLYFVAGMAPVETES
jgi:PAS domain S-box-containing protein